MQLTSPAYQPNNTLPVDYTCKGKGINPPLNISDVPNKAQSLALIMHDPDAIGGRDFLHWSVWNIPPNTTQIAEGTVPEGAIQGTNDYRQLPYGPACPPAGTGTHRYMFDLYALDINLNLPEGADRKTLEDAIQGHVIAAVQLIAQSKPKAILEL